MVPTTLEFHHSRFDPAELAARRGGLRVSVCIPARDEAATVAAVVSAVRRELTSNGGGADLVDEIVVVDDGSSDDTTSVARRAGANVVPAGTRGAERARPWR